ncbi:Acetyl-CoA acetyltransferase A, partial [Durusdinium trenchii]
MAGRSVVIVGAKRTPIGTFMGGLASLSAPQLGVVAAKGAVAAAGLTPEDIEEVYMGNVLQAGIGQAPARQVALGAGMALDTPSTTINKVCASGMKSVMMAAQSIALGDRKVMLAGGMESMSQVPHYMRARTATQYGNVSALDGIQHDGLTDPGKNILMGLCTEGVVKELGISREDQDAFAISSYEKARQAQADGVLASEIAEVVITDRRGKETVVSEDEECKKFFPEKFASLRPAFDKEGTITPANASKINDGAAALVLMDEQEAKDRGLQALARIVGYEDAAVEPHRFALAPTKACEKLFAKTGTTKADVDFHEINEAFAAVVLGNMQLLGLDPAKVNVHGGGCSLGHPIGTSGSRILLALINVLQRRDATLGMASICNGGGGASAVLLEPSGLAHELSLGSNDETKAKPKAKPEPFLTGKFAASPLRARCPARTWRATAACESDRRTRHGDDAAAEAEKQALQKEEDEKDHQYLDVKLHHNAEEVKAQLFAPPDLDALSQEVTSVWGWVSSQSSTIAEKAAKLAEQAAPVAEKVREKVSSVAEAAEVKRREMYKQMQEAAAASGERPAPGVLPWKQPGCAQFADDIKHRVLELSKDEKTFTIPPPEGVGFDFNYEQRAADAILVLQEDAQLQERRLNLVPKQIDEQSFWRNYFYRVSLITEAFQVSHLDGTEPASADGVAAHGSGDPVVGQASGTDASTTTHVHDGLSKRKESTESTDDGMDGWDDHADDGLDLNDQAVGGDENFDMLDDEELLAAAGLNLEDSDDDGSDDGGDADLEARIKAELQLDDDDDDNQRARVGVCEIVPWVVQTPGERTKRAVEELEAELSEADRASLDVIHKAWQSKDEVLGASKQAEVLGFLEELLVGTIEETCPMPLTVRVLHGFGLQQGDVLTGTDAYVEVSLQGDESKFRTQTVNNTKSPSWDEVFVFDKPGACVGSMLKLNVFDDDLFSDDALGSVEVPVERRRKGHHTNETIQLLLKGGRGTIVFNYALKFPSLGIKSSTSFDDVLANCDEAIDMIARASPEKASEVRAKISAKIQGLAEQLETSSRVVVRQEIRTLSEEMSARYLAAIKLMMVSNRNRKHRDGHPRVGNKVDETDLKESKEDQDLGGTSEFFRLAGYHGYPDEFCAHRQENFPVWHRAYLLDFENELQHADRELGNDGNIGLPYWDFGTYEINGQVIPKIYAELEGLPGDFFRPEDKGIKLARQGFKLNSDEVALAKLERNNMAESLAASLEENSHWKHASCENTSGMPLEAPHNSAHMAAGFPLTSLAFAAFHPLFYNIHCNVDRYYEKYLQLEPDSKEEFKLHQAMRTQQSSEEVSNKFEEALAPFHNLKTKEPYTVDEIMSCATHEIGYVFDAVPKTRPPQMRELPTLALFEKVDVVRSLLDQEGNMKSFELHVFVLPKASAAAWTPPLDKHPTEWASMTTKSDVYYAGWATALGGLGNRCRNCQETKPVNVAVDISAALRDLGHSRHAVTVATLCVDEDGTVCRLEELPATFGETCQVPSPRVVGPFFESPKASLSREGCASTPRDDTASEVTQLQRYLATYGFYSGQVDGTFGPVTERGVKAFQEYLGFEEDGVVGPHTKRAMLMTRNDHHPDKTGGIEAEDSSSENQASGEADTTFSDQPRFPKDSTVTWWLGPHPGYLSSKQVAEEVQRGFAIWQEAVPLCFEPVERREDAQIQLIWTDRAEENQFKFDGEG